MCLAIDHLPPEIRNHRTEHTLSQMQVFHPDDRVCVDDAYGGGTGEVMQRITWRDDRTSYADLYIVHLEDNRVLSLRPQYLRLANR